MRIQTLLAWSLLRTLQPDSAGDRSAFVAEASPIRLDAFESFVRGVTDSSPQQRIQRFREAVRLAPNYRQAWLELGETYYSLRDYAQAVAALGHVPPTGSSGREAGFYLGLASFYQGDFARAESAFRAVTASLPLPEIYNNLGVATAPRSARESATHFAKAVDDDPTDADYRFNLGLALFRAGDFSGAARQLKESLALRPSDAEAKSMLQAATSAAAATTANAAPASAKLPPQRLKSSYDENAFRQLSVKLQAAVEARLAKSDAATHARYHVARGQEFLAQGFTTEAVQNLREAVVLDPGNPEAHAALARALEAASDTAEARTEARREAEAALRLKSFAEPLLVLVRLDLRENKTDEAAHSVDQALQLEPGNSSAQALKRSVAAKLAEKAQPLPNP